MARVRNSRTRWASGEAVRPRKTPQQARSRQLVEDLLEASARILGERGYAATTTNAVAERAGVSVGSLYQYFPGKAALASALYQQHRLQVAAAVAAAVKAAEGELETGVEGVVRAMWDEHRSHPQLHQVLELEFHAQHLVPATDAVRREVERLLAAHRSALPGKDPRAASTVVLALIRGLVHAAILDRQGGWAGLDPVTEIARAVRGYLGCQPPPSRS